MVSMVQSDSWLFGDRPMLREFVPDADGTVGDLSGPTRGTSPTAVTFGLRPGAMGSATEFLGTIYE
jgi:hypothetical protein